MKNTLQPNPSNAADDFVQPDWNSKHGEGTGTEGLTEGSADLQENYEKQREGAKALREGKNPAS